MSCSNLLSATIHRPLATSLMTCVPCVLWRHRWFSFCWPSSFRFDQLHKQTNKPSQLHRNPVIDQAIDWQPCWTLWSWQCKTWYTSPDRSPLSPPWPSFKEHTLHSWTDVPQAVAANLTPPTPLSQLASPSPPTLMGSVIGICLWREIGLHYQSLFLVSSPPCYF